MGFASEESNFCTDGRARDEGRGTERREPCGSAPGGTLSCSGSDDKPSGRRSEYESISGTTPASDVPRGLVPEPTKSPRITHPGPKVTWPDERLVEACLSGSEEAWCALIDKYRNLIFSIPVKYGLAHDDANEIFQQVSMILLSHLSQVREPRTLPAWLIKTTARECWSWRRQTARHTGVTLEHPSAAAAIGTAELPEDAIRELQREQALREAVLSLPPRCRKLIEMLFFDRPAVPYAEVAERLGVAKGSIGFIRMRCLRRLRQQLEKSGFSG